MDYWQYYGFSRMPFGEDSDREVFFRSETHKEALALMLYGIRERKGYIVIIGQQGMGKTTLIRQVMDQLDERTRVALISKSHDLGFTFLKELMEKLGLRAKGVTKGSMLHELYEFLIQCLKNGENIVVFLDDAHRMKDEIIEELRLMSNFQTSRTKLIQIVVAGEPELDRRLNSKHMRQIRQRIQILHRLLPLGQDESLQYIEHRLACAGGSSGDVFTPEALASICKYAGGIPQNINTLCDQTLTLGAERSEKPISAGTVAAARKTVAPLIRPSTPSHTIAGTGRSALRSPWLYAALAVAVTGVFLGSYFLDRADVQPVLNQKASDAGEAARAQSPAGTQPPGLPSEKQETPPASLAAEATGADKQEPTDANDPVKEVTVTEGATLTTIATRQYGFVNATILDRILESNPEIVNVDFIRAGSQVLLPQDAGEAKLLKRPDGSLSIHAATFMTYREAQDYLGKVGSDLGNADIVKKSVAPQKDWYRILVGSFGSREEARTALQSMKRRTSQ
jgi:general secretion pathway protein A